MIKLNAYKKIALASVAVIAIGVIALAVQRHGHGNNNVDIPSTNPAADNSSNGSSAPSSGSNSAGSSSDSAANDSTEAGGPPPLVPSGDFISNHHPGGDNPTSEASVCNTSEGAVCYIELTKGADTKKLDARTIDAKGAAYWYWDIKTAGLSSGSWTVTAVATLNGQTKTASDPQLLVVQ